MALKSVLAKLEALCYVCKVIGLVAWKHVSYKPNGFGAFIKFFLFPGIRVFLWIINGPTRSSLPGFPTLSVQRFNLICLQVVLFSMDGLRIMQPKTSSDLLWHSSRLCSGSYCSLLQDNNNEGHWKALVHNLCHYCLNYLR